MTIWIMIPLSDTQHELDSLVQNLLISDGEGSFLDEKRIL